MTTSIVVIVIVAGIGAFLLWNTIGAGGKARRSRTNGDAHSAPLPYASLDTVLTQDTVNHADCAAHAADTSGVDCGGHGA